MFRINEDAVANDSAGFATLGAPIGGTLAWSLTSDSSGRFAIDSGTGELTYTGTGGINADNTGVTNAISGSPLLFVDVRVTNGTDTVTERLYVKSVDVVETINVAGTTQVRDHGDGGDTFIGDAANNNIVGDAGDNRIEGNDGADTLQGYAGDDIILGGVGNDNLIGHDGDDSIEGGDGNDTLTGNDGNDTLLGGDGNDNINGGDGDDIINQGIGAGTLTGGGGADQFIAGGSCLLYTSPSPRDGLLSRMPSSA